MTCGPLLSSQARMTCARLMPRASAMRWKAANASSSRGRRYPPSGLHATKARPSSPHSSSSGREDRNPGENWFCTATRRSPRMLWASRIWSGLALEMPAVRAKPSSRIPARVRTMPSYSTLGSGRCKYSRSIWSVRNASAESFASRRSRSGDPSTSQTGCLASLKQRKCPTLVATEIVEWSPSHDAKASVTSLSPYCSTPPDS